MNRIQRAANRQGDDTSATKRNTKFVKLQFFLIKCRHLQNSLALAMLALVVLSIVQAHPALAAIHLGSPNTAALSNGLVGYWTFDGPVTNWNTNTTADLSGQGNTGQMINMSTSSSPVAGKIGQVLKFDGSASYADLGNSTTLNPTSALTLSAWVKANSLGGSGAANWLIARDDGSLGRSFAFGVKGDGSKIGRASCRERV